MTSIGPSISRPLRPKVRTKPKNVYSHEKPVVRADGPGQVWSWDITDLNSPWYGKRFKGYKITDIYSRETVGWRVEERESDHLAVEMFEEAIKLYGAPRIVHADSGPAMRSNLLKDVLAKHGIVLTHNRPYVSNDNPFSEAGFRTMKYRPEYPKYFDDLDTARKYVAGYVSWYNNVHKHSGIALFTPSQVGDGSWREVWVARDKVLQNYYLKHPERFNKKPYTPAPAGVVGINLPCKENSVEY